MKKSEIDSYTDILTSEEFWQNYRDDVVLDRFEVAFIIWGYDVVAPAERRALVAALKAEVRRAVPPPYSMRVSDGCLLARWHLPQPVRADNLSRRKIRRLVDETVRVVPELTAGEFVSSRFLEADLDPLYYLQRFYLSRLRATPDFH